MKKILAIVAAVLLLVFMTSFAVALDNGPVYEPLMAAESLEEFRGILLDESNRARVMALTYEEIASLSCRVEHLYTSVANPSDDDDYYVEELLETLSILPNGPETLDGNPVTLASLSTVASGTTITQNTTYSLDKTFTLNGTIIIDKGATLTIESTGAYEITRGSSCGVMFRINSGNLILKGTGGTITINGASLSKDTVMIAAWGGVQCNNVKFMNATNTSNDTNWRGGAINVHSGTTQLTNCTFTNNSAVSGGAIFCNSSLSISGCTFSNNTATGTNGEGGAIRVAGSFSISTTTFSNNKAPNGTTHGGTLYIAASQDSSIESCVISGSVGGNGSAIYMGGSTERTVTLKNSLIYGCSHGADNGGDGGTIRTNGAGRVSLTIEGCVIRGNTSTRGGVAYWNSQVGTLTIKDSQLLNNTATINGGALYMEGYALNISGTGNPANATAYSANTAPSGLKGTLIQGNTAVKDGDNTGLGGAICVAGYNSNEAADNTTTIKSGFTTTLGSNVLIKSNTAYNGAAIAYLLTTSNIFAAGQTFTVDINGAILENNTAENIGGAIYMDVVGTKAYVPTVNMSSGSIRSNISDRGGAAYVKKGVFKLTGGNVGESGKGNTADNRDNANPAGNGGAFYVEGGTLNLSGGTIAYNSAIASGGAICVYSSGVVDLKGSTLSNNTAKHGGAICLDGGTVDMTSGTISANQTMIAGGGGGGVRVAGGVFTMTGGTITGNTALHGGGIRVDSGTCNISSGTISDNIACGNDESNGGGGLFLTGGTTNIGVKSCTHSSHPQITGNSAGHPSKNTSPYSYYGYGGGIYVQGSNAKANMYCGNLDNNTAQVYGYYFASSFYQTAGEFNWCGGNLDIGNHVKAGTFKARNAANTADDTLYKITYHINEVRDTSIGDEPTTDNNPPKNNQYKTYQFVRKSNNVITLPAGDLRGMNDARYGSSQNTHENGWTCMGWDTDRDQAKNLTRYTPVGASYTVNGNVTLYAAWTKARTGKITYNYNGNGTANTTQNYNISPTSATITAPQPTRTGYTFAGWKVTSASAGKWTNGDVYAKGAKIDIGGKYGNVTLTAQWTPNKYTYNIVYKSSSGVQLGTATAEYKFDTTNTIAPKEFTGYTAPGSQSVKWDSTSPKTITFTYAPIEYTISYTLNGGSQNSPKTKYTIETATFSLVNPTKTGYTFTGWTGSNGNTAQTSVSIAKGSTGNKSYTANWKANTNTAYKVQHWQQKLGAGVTQNSTNYTLKDTDNLTGTTASKVTPSRKSYSGFTAPTGTEITIAADGSTVLNYYYTRNSYTVTVNKGTGISSVSGDGTYQYGASVTIDATPASGYSWNGWTGTHSTSEKQHTFTMPASDVEDTANAKAITYDITYNLDGGSVDPANPATYDVTTNTFTLKNPTKTGYTFTGWTGSNGSTAQLTVSVGKGSIGDKSYTANWTPNNYTYSVVYKSVSGTSLGSTTVTHAYGTTNTISPISITGYAKPGDQSVIWDSVAEKTITFTYTPIEYTIDYNLSGGSVNGNPTSYTIESNAITLINPTRDAYNFAGWTGTGLANASTSVTIPSGSVGDRSYVATWTAIEYTAQFNANGGSVVPESKTFTVVGALSLPTPQRAGYKFLGWMVTSAAGNWTAGDTYTSSVNAGQYGNVTFTAQWELAAVDFVINVSGLTSGQNAVIKVSGIRADRTPFKDFSFAVVENGTTTLAALPVGTYTVTVNGGWTWRFNHAVTANGAYVVNIVFSANGNVQWLNAYGQAIN